MARDTAPPPEALKQAASSLDAGVDPRPDDLECMLRSVHEAIRHEDCSVSGYLRSRPTWMRRALLFGALSVPLLVALAASAHSEWEGLRKGATAVIALVIAAFAIACAWLSTRPLQRRGLTRGLDWALFLAAIGTMAIAALVNSDSQSGTSTSAHDVACLGAGALVAMPAMLAGRLLHRGTLSAPLLTATAAALMTNLAQLVACPVTEAGHCLLGHVSLALWLALPVLMLRRLFPGL